MIRLFLSCSFIDVFLFSLLGLNLELLIMNVPAGKTVTRITRTKKLPFPGKPKNIKLDFLPLLEATLMGKALMENLARIIDDRKRKAVELNTAEKATSPRLPFSLCWIVFCLNIFFYSIILFFQSSAFFFAFHFFIFYLHWSCYVLTRH